MRNFNLTVLEGRLVSDPELRYTQNGTALCSFSIANNNDYYKDDELQKQVNFVDVTTWAKLAERCNEFLKKGNRIIINGRLKQDRWQDDNGGNRSKISIVGNQVQFLDLKNGDGESEKTDGDELY
ncbi:MAG: single-stranded DNA-binding protein [Spirochaetes bacterium]|nr:single-stranded DNA-binding protein [Spirochaetota bacterium]